MNMAIAFVIGSTIAVAPVNETRHSVKTPGISASIDQIPGFRLCWVHRSIRIDGDTIVAREETECVYY